MNQIFLDEDSWKYPTFNRGTWIGNHCYFARNDKSGIFQWDLQKKQLKLLFLDKNSMATSFLYGNCVHIENKLFFIPCVSSHLLEFDLKENTWNFYAIDFAQCKKRGSFFGGAHQASRLWLIPKSSETIAYFDIKKKVFRYIDLYNKISSYCDKSWGHIERDEVFAMESIWMLLWASNIVVQFCTSDFSMSIHRVGETGEAFRGISFDGNDFWLSTHLGNLLRWNPVSGEKRCYSRVLDGKDFIFEIVSNKVWAFAGNGKTYAIIDLFSGQQTLCELPFDDTPKDFGIESFGDRYLFLMPTQKQRNGICIDCATHQISKLLLNISDEDMLLYQSTLLEHMPQYFFEGDYSLNTLFWILNSRTTEFSKIHESKIIGSEIYKVVSKSI